MGSGCSPGGVTVRVPSLWEWAASFRGGLCGLRGLCSVLGMSFRWNVGIPDTEKLSL